MLDDDGQEEQFKSESAKGRRAAAANEEFFQPFFVHTEEILIKAFREVSVTNSEALLNIRLQFKALDALKGQIDSFIATGKMASQTLLENEENKDEN